MDFPDFSNSLESPSTKFACKICSYNFSVRDHEESFIQSKKILVSLPVRGHFFVGCPYDDNGFCPERILQGSFRFY